MINLKKFLLLPLLIILSSCGTLSDVGKTMRNEKIISNDEFLVKKKEPLTLPPDFAAIPEPGTLERKENEDIERKKIEEVFRIKKEKNVRKKNSKSVEESILRRIEK